MAGNIERHIFAGGNTGLGFFSYYDYIINWEEAERIYILKGGPGVGKSTFMKEIASEISEKGYSVEYFHCSSDSSSLDGVVFKELKVAIVDGTAPHVIDPRYPGAVDVIINLGDFWNTDKIKKHRQEIIEKRREIKKCFDRAYRYLKAASLIYEDISAYFKNYIYYDEIDRISNELSGMLFSNQEVKKEGREGKERRLFAGAITPNGLENYLESILTTSKVYKLQIYNEKYKISGESEGLKTAAEKILTKIRDNALEKGYFVESFYCALFPEKIEHIVIPELDVSVTTANKFHNIRRHDCEVIELNKLYDKKVLSRYRDFLTEDENELKLLLNTAINSIKVAKSYHHEIEKYYSSSMDFEKLKQQREDIKNSIIRDALVV